MNNGRIGRFLGSGAAFLFFLNSLGCTDLPDLALDTCGNYVIDEGEDCDIHADSPFVCAGPGETNACHYTCIADEVPCPDGYGCGLDGVCRRNAGIFELQTTVDSYSWPTSIRGADFDSDGNGDLLLLGAIDSFGYRSSRALYTQGFTVHPGLTILPTEIANPVIGAGSGDGVLRDLAFADFEGVVLLRGYDDRTADFTVFPTIYLPPGTHARIVMTDALPDRTGDEFLAVINTMGGTNSLVGIEYGRPMRNLISVAGGEDALSGTRGMVSGQFDESTACQQVVLGYHDASNISVYTPCKINGGMYDWNVNGSVVSVALESSAKIDRGVIATDIDGDGHLDLVIGAQGRTYVAYGIGDGQFTSQKTNGTPNTASPYVLPLLAGGAENFPLAIADLNADGIPDFVMDFGVVLSKNGDYFVAFENQGALWSEAVVANMNGNDLPDIAAVVGGALDIHFLNNAGDGIFGGATLATEGIASHLRVGDFDGDFLNDLVFSEAISEHGELSDHLAFAFGSAYGAPQVPEATGEVGEVGEIVTGHVEGESNPDPMTEVGVVVEGNSGHADSIALLPGRASRAIYSTLPLRTGPILHLPVSLAFGNFGDETPDIVALATSTMDGSLSLFRIESSDQEGLSVPEASDPLPANFIPSDIATSINLRYGATVVATDLDKDGVDEALVVGAYANRQQGAFAVAKYDFSTQKFSIIDAQVFAGAITTDSTLFVEDLDGDGYRDFVLTTGTLDSPSDLVVVWGDGTGRVPDLTQNIARIRFDNFGVTAVTALRSPTGHGKMLVASTRQAAYLLEFNGTRSYTKTDIPEIGPARSFVAIDFDRDGVEDLAAQTEVGLELIRSIPK